MFLQLRTLTDHFVIGAIILQAFYKFYAIFYWGQYFVPTE